MNSQVGRWVLGLVYIFAVACIWIAASFVVQSVVDAGVSPFLVTYICNSLFVIYIPLVEFGRYLEDSCGGFGFWKSKESSPLQELGESEQTTLLGDGDAVAKTDAFVHVQEGQIGGHREVIGTNLKNEAYEPIGTSSNLCNVNEIADEKVDAKGRWTRTRVAKVSLLISPFWFMAQLTFNLSLKYTTVTSNTILSSSSSLFTFLVSLAFLGESFTLVKLFSVLLCMGGTIIVSLGDSRTTLSSIASNPVLGDILALVSAAFYSVYITLIRKKLPDEDDEKSGRASMAQFLGFLGLSNLLIFLPAAIVLHFSKLESFYILTWKQLGLIVGKGLFDNVLSDYLWAKAVLLTTTTVATAGLSIQVPLAAILDTLTGHTPHFADFIGALVVMIGFTGINIPADAFNRSKEVTLELEDGSNRNRSPTGESGGSSRRPDPAAPPLQTEVEHT